MFVITNFDNVFVVKITITKFINVLSIYKIYDAKNARINTKLNFVHLNLRNARYVITNIKLRRIIASIANKKIKK